MDERVQEFFAEYAKSYGRLDDVEPVLRMLTVPLSFFSDHGPTVFHDRASLAANFETLLERYRTIGVTEARYTIGSTQALSEKMIMAKVNWKFMDAAGAMIYAANVGYFLVQLKDGMKIMGVVLLDEPAKLKAALERAATA